MVDFSNLPLVLGPVTASPSAMLAITATGESAASLLARHAAGDWGVADDETRSQNWVAITSDLGLVCSVYSFPTGRKIIIVTEMFPRQTSLITPEEV